jgi:SAM-dependent methyltransferase
MSLSEFWQKWEGKAVKSLRRRGTAGTIKHAAAALKHVLIQGLRRYFVVSPWHPLKLYLDKRFDRNFKVDTAGLVILPEVHADPRFNAYSPTPHSFFFHWLRQIKVDYSKFTFIDLGCGKGKVLLLAATLPFKEVIGVELSPKLLRIAENNLTTYRGKRQCKAIRLSCTDARNFELPAEPSIFYLFDPFEGELMEEVLQNIRRSLVAAPREIYILYYMAQHERLLYESGFLTPVKQSSGYCVYTAAEVNRFG